MKLKYRSEIQVPPPLGVPLLRKIEIWSKIQVPPPLLRKIPPPLGGTFIL
jgi:hypothetical protein